MPNPFYITTPIYYVNDVPHIGHAYTTVAADVLARYHRLRGDEVFFLTGLDEHGQKVQQAAAKAGIAPQAHCDAMVPRFQDLWKKLNISNNAFIRTTDTPHKAVVQRLLQQLYDKGEIYRDSYTGWYCTFDERFWTEKDVLVEQDKKLCPDCKRSVEQLSESNYFFRMSTYQERLIAHIHAHPDFIKPESRRNEVLGFLHKPLGDLSISRPKSRLSWGIELPFDTNYVTYVWFDALVNYVSALEYLTPAPAMDHFWPASVHLVGKDILTTHAVYWSTMLMGLGLPLPQTIFAHGWWTVNGEKMSKSRGNMVDPNTMVDEFGVDAFRYFLLREVPFGHDGDFSREAMIVRINSELANGIGNLLSRTLTMIERFAGGNVPQDTLPATEDVSHELQHQARGLPSALDIHIGNLEFNKALEAIASLVQTANQFIDKMAPWSLAKKPDSGPLLAHVLYNLAETLHIVSDALIPFMPDTAAEMKRQLGLSPEPLLSAHDGKGQSWSTLQPGTPIAKSTGLFPRIDTKPTQTKIQPGGTRVSDHHPSMSSSVPTPAPAVTPATVPSPIPAAPTAAAAGITQPAAPVQITIDEFQRIQLKVATVLSAERVPRSEKLLKLQVDLGTEQRQIVSGIGKKYEPDQLVGKKIVIVANLKPAKLMGIESQGMVLAAGDLDVKCLVGPMEDADPGTKVK
jgi:methionyl-tRNA synthetase